VSLSPGAIIDPLSKRVPVQDWEMIIKHAERFRRAADALKIWSETAKECVDFFEGKQWRAEDVKKLEREGRPALNINKIRPLVNLVLGYHLNNQTDIGYLPGNDGTGTADMARVLSALSKQISEVNELPYIDSEVFLDGLLTARGYWDLRLDFDRNMKGEAVWTAVDPFTVYLDPDAQAYDLNTGTYVMTSRWISVEEVEYFYGQDAANLIRPLTNGMTFNQFPSTMYEGADEVTPFRRFGGDEDNPSSWRIYSDQFYNWIDTYRKTIRMLDIQHYIRTKRWFFVDLETGDQRPVPDDWDQERTQRVMLYAKQMNWPLVLTQKLTRRVRWTHMVGDVIVFDEWSPYDTFTVVPYFPYFRRGRTQGMVEHLLDPQREINVRRSARQNIIGRSSNGGWKYAKGSLDAQQKRNLEINGGRPGFQMEYDTKNGSLPPPEMIQPGQSPVSVEQLEKEAENDLKEIAGINDSALGQVDQATISGRAIQARQQQTVIGLEGFIDNYHRSKRLCGKKQLEVIQGHYTEPRVIRANGSGAQPLEALINQKSAEGILNDVTFGNYAADIQEMSLSDSFLQGQFNELMQLKQMGMPIPDDFIIDASSIGRKEELRIALKQARQAQAQQQAAAGAAPGSAPPGAGGGPQHGPPQQGPGPGGSKVGPDGGSLPSGPEPGAPLPAGGPMGGGHHP
jgi:hypothetical protein